MPSEAAFEDIFHTHFRDLLKFCTPRVLNPVDAEDAAQDTMLKAHRALSRPQAQRPGPTWPWLEAIAVNACRDVNRRRRRTLIEQPAELPVSWTDDHLDTMIRREVMEEALAALPDRYIRILVLKHLGGFGHAKIAKLLGTSSASARSSIRRAKRALARKVEQVARKKESWPLPGHPDSQMSHL